VTEPRFGRLRAHLIGGEGAEALLSGFALSTRLGQRLTELHRMTLWRERPFGPTMTQAVEGGDAVAGWTYELAELVVLPPLEKPVTAVVGALNVRLEIETDLFAAVIPMALPVASLPVGYEVTLRPGPIFQRRGVRDARRPSTDWEFVRRALRGRGIREESGWWVVDGVHVNTREAAFRVFGYRER
jgi:hypothetical protein